MARSAPLSLLLLAACPSRATADGSRLHIRNGCERESIWIAHMAGGQVGPDAQNVEIKSGAVHEFATPQGLSATRYWPKMGCDELGGNCELGGSGGPGENCVRRPPEVPKDDYSHCAPPVDTKFEGTFGNPSQPCTDAAAQGCDYIDMSLVDGWTLPFELKVHGTCTGAWGKKSDLSLDCQNLTLDRCPQDERLATVGNMVADLRALHPKTFNVAGCYSPCQRFVSDKWGQEGMDPADPKAAPYCCPTPPESPEACRKGPLVTSAYLKAVHGLCPGVYGYAYDDGMGLLRCEPTSTYELTFFCPDNTTNFRELMLARGGKKPAWEMPGNSHEFMQQVKASVMQQPIGGGSPNESTLASGGVFLLLAAIAAYGLPLVRHVRSWPAGRIRGLGLASRREASSALYERAPQSLDAPIFAA